MDGRPRSKTSRGGNVSGHFLRLKAFSEITWPEGRQKVCSTWSGAVQKGQCVTSQHRESDLIHSARRRFKSNTLQVLKLRPDYVALLFTLSFRCDPPSVSCVNRTRPWSDPTHAQKKTWRQTQRTVLDAFFKFMCNRSLSNEVILLSVCHCDFNLPASSGAELWRLSHFNDVKNCMKCSIAVQTEVASENWDMYPI